MPSALIFLAEDSEEIELVVTADVLTRAKIDVTIASLNGDSPVKCSRNVRIAPDIALADVSGKDFDIVIVPGGSGVVNVQKSDLCGEVLRKQDTRGGWIAAICAGPTVFITHKIASGKTVTSYPSFQGEMEAGGFKYTQEKVHIDGNIITSRGPATAMLFALTCASKVCGEDMMDAVGGPMLFEK